MEQRRLQILPSEVYYVINTCTIASAVLGALGLVEPEHRRCDVRRSMSIMQEVAAKYRVGRATVVHGWLQARRELRPLYSRLCTRFGREASEVVSRYAPWLSFTTILGALRLPALSRGSKLRKQRLLVLRATRESIDAVIRSEQGLSEEDAELLLLTENLDNRGYNAILVTCDERLAESAQRKGLKVLHSRSSRELHAN